MSARLRRARPWCRAFALLFACALSLAGPADAQARNASSSPATPVAEQPVAVPDPLPLAWCIERARQASPEIARAAALAEAARHKVVPAGSLEDPRVSYEVSNLPTGTFDLDSTPMSGQQLGLRQKLPFPGVLGGRRRAAEHGADAAALEHADRALRVAGAVEQAWSELAFAQRALEITESNVELLRQLVGTAESRYRVGSGLQQDVLRAQVELTALLGQRLKAAADVAAAEARLVALLDLPAETQLPAVLGLQSEAALPALDALLGAAERTNAVLRAAEARVEEQREHVRIAQLRGYPDIDVGFPALAGLAAETGVIMLLFLNQARELAVAEGRMRSVEDVWRATVEGATQRARPLLMTVASDAIGLLPIMWGAGTGSETMRRIAAPMVGGVVSVTLVTLFVLPVAYAMLHGRGFRNGGPQRKG